MQIVKTVLEVILLAILSAPEGKSVCINGIVCRVADQAIIRNILVVVEFMNDGLVELPQIVSVCTFICMSEIHTSIGRESNAVAVVGPNDWYEVKRLRYSRFQCNRGSGLVEEEGLAVCEDDIRWRGHPH